MTQIDRKTHVMCAHSQDVRIWTYDWTSGSSGDDVMSHCTVWSLAECMSGGCNFIRWNKDTHRHSSLRMGAGEQGRLPEHWAYEGKMLAAYSKRKSLSGSLCLTQHWAYGLVFPFFLDSNTYLLNLHHSHKVFKGLCTRKTQNVNIFAKY